VKLERDPFHPEYRDRRSPGIELVGRVSPYWPRPTLSSNRLAVSSLIRNKQMSTNINRLAGRRNAKPETLGVFPEPFLGRDLSTQRTS